MSIPIAYFHVHRSSHLHTCKYYYTCANIAVSLCWGCALFLCYTEILDASGACFGSQAVMYCIYILGANSRGISLSKNLFQEHSSVGQFKFDLVFETEVGTARAQVGSASLIAFVNTPPHGGTCHITPTYVPSSSTPFYVTCQDWKDDRGVTMYEIYGK